MSLRPRLRSRLDDPFRRQMKDGTARKRRYYREPFASLIRLSALFWCAALIGAAQSPQSTPADREAHWREDLQFFAQHFSSGHCTPSDLIHNPIAAFQPCHQADFAKLYPQPAFDNEIRAIEESIPSLTDSQIVLRLARLVATGNVGHTYVQLPSLGFGFRPLPLSLHWYSNELAILATTPQYTAALGTRVLRIGPLTPEQALAAVAPYISHENKNWLRTFSAGYLTKMGVLRQIGVVDADSSVKLTLAKPGGEPFSLAVMPREPEMKDIFAFDELHVPAALYRTHPNTYYWYEYLPESHALYVQYNSCENDPKQSFSDFTRGLFAFADAHPVERAIVDLRFNGGGNSRVIIPLKSGLRARHFPVFVLIGDATFSSAQDNAIEMRRELHATLVGQATGEKPNSYGEVRQLKLPNSGLKIRYSTEFFRLIKDGDPDALYPDIPVANSLEDALAGRDRTLDAALRASTKR